MSFAEPAFGRCHQHIALYPIYISLLTSKYQAAVRRVETHWRRQWAASPRSTDRSVGVYLTSNLPDASILQIPPSWLKALPSWEDCPLSMRFLCICQSRIGARNKGTAARQGLVPWVCCRIFSNCADLVSACRIAFHLRSCFQFPEDIQCLLLARSIKHSSRISIRGGLKLMIA